MPAGWRPSSGAARHLLPASGAKDLALRDIPPYRPHHRPRPVDLHLDRAVAAVLLRRLRLVGEVVLRAQLLLELRVGLAELLLAVDEIRRAAGLRGERLHDPAAAQPRDLADADADEVQRHAGGARVREHVL